MIFPIGDDQVKGGSFPLFAYAFIALNVIIFFYQISLGQQGAQQFITHYGTIPQEITSGQDWFTMITSMFLHGGWMHLIGNMLFLWVFADNIEATVGNVKFLLFYLIGGIVASMAHIMSGPTSAIPSVGASGAISAVMGAYLVMFPFSKIKMLVLIFFRSFRVAAILFLGLWIGQQLLAGLGSLASTSQTGGVAWWAHIGGFVFGVLAGFYFKKRSPRIPTSRTAIEKINHNGFQDRKYLKT